jgi:hypothetical protein
VPHESVRKPVSSPRRVKRSVPISGTPLSCLLRFKTHENDSYNFLHFTNLALLPYISSSKRRRGQPTQSISDWASERFGEYRFRVRERFAQKFSTCLILKTSIVNLARTDASRIPIIRSSLRHQNQICGEPPIADHSRHCLSAIEKLRFRKGSVGFESETSADRLSPANPRILNRMDPAHAGIIKD